MRTSAVILAALAAFTVWALTPIASAQPADCAAVRHDGNRYTICTVDMAKSEVRLFLNQDDGTPYGSFRALPHDVSVAMNGGMYHADRSPVGHYLENGTQERGLITRAGPGNFGLLPNGVLCLGAQTAQVIETLQFEAQSPDCRYATQSGPMLVIDGALHPRFLKDSNSFKRRNGVGTTEDGKTLYMVLSENSVTFHEFGRLFRDMLKVPQALFLDGTISRMYIRDQGRLDGGPAMGPILAVIDPSKS